MTINTLDANKTGTIIYSCAAYQTTCLDAMKQFVFEYWDNPRTIEEQKGNLFTVANGIATYKVTYIPEIPYETFATWKIARL